jgi:hypothetical protein
MKSIATRVARPIFDRDEYFESSSRTIRWIVMALILITYPFDDRNAPIILTMVGIFMVYNSLRYVPKLNNQTFFASRLNSLTIDHVFVCSFFPGPSPITHRFSYSSLLPLPLWHCGVCLSLSVQVIITLVLLKLTSRHTAGRTRVSVHHQAILLIIFSLVAEQSVRSHDEEYLLKAASPTA